jgi:hypothetical protein
MHKVVQEEHCVERNRTAYILHKIKSTLTSVAELWVLNQKKEA